MYPAGWSSALLADNGEHLNEKNRDLPLNQQKGKEPFNPLSSISAQQQAQVLAAKAEAQREQAARRKKDSKLQETEAKQASRTALQNLLKKCSPIFSDNFKDNYEEAYIAVESNPQMGPKGLPRKFAIFPSTSQSNIANVIFCKQNWHISYPINDQLPEAILQQLKTRELINAEEFQREKAALSTAAAAIKVKN